MKQLVAGTLVRFTHCKLRVQPVYLCGKRFCGEKKLISIVPFYPKLVANNLARPGMLSVYALYKHYWLIEYGAEQRWISGITKHNKKQSGTLRKPFINKEKERKNVSTGIYHGKK